ncbi:MAG: S-methyl-5-thioribose-1-phosphate isomerase [Actinomycetota bacterium]
MTPQDGVEPVSEEELAAFRAVGEHLARRELISGAEGNLSTYDGRRLVITRSGSRLDALAVDDVLVGTPTVPPTASSSDLGIHLENYDVNDANDSPRRVGAVVHAHPPGSVPAGWAEGQPHGAYGLGRTLEHAAATLEIYLWAADRGPVPSAATGVGPSSPVFMAFAHESWGPVEGWNRTGPTLSILDQTRLPAAAGWVRCETVEDVSESIRRLAVRGAPALGVTAALGTALAAFRARDRGEDAREAATKAGALLVATRPTAVNIRWAVGRALAAGATAGDDRQFAEAVLSEARAIEFEDAQACSRMGWLGASLIPAGANVLTHCNTGMLCTAGIGTALGVLWCAHLAGKGVHVWVDETRPLLQGSRLTAWELEPLGVPFTVIADSAAGSLMARGRVDAVVVGADRIAANGDVANKIGTYPLAVLAARHGVPFLVVAPTSTIDLGTGSGDDIRIEERDPEEVTHAFGTRVAPEGAPALNLAFDVTPAELVTAIVTERGVVRAAYREALAAVVGGVG